MTLLPADERRLRVMVVLRDLLGIRRRDESYLPPSLRPPAPLPLSAGDFLMGLVECVVRPYVAALPDDYPDKDVLVDFALSVTTAVEVEVRFPTERFIQGREGPDQYLGYLRTQFSDSELYIFGQMLVKMFSPPTGATAGTETPTSPDPESYHSARDGAEDSTGSSCQGRCGRTPVVGSEADSPLVGCETVVEGLGGPTAATSSVLSRPEGREEVADDGTS